MPEKNNKETVEVFCNCDNCRVPMRYNHTRFFVARLFLGLAILFLMFYVGFKLGEFKGTFDSGYGPGMFGQRHNMMYFNDEVPGTFRQMILPKNLNTETQTTTPSTSTTTSGTSTK